MGSCGDRIIRNGVWGLCDYPDTLLRKVHAQIHIWRYMVLTECGINQGSAYIPTLAKNFQVEHRFKWSDNMTSDPRNTNLAWSRSCLQLMMQAPH